MMRNSVKSFDILATSLRVLQNYFDAPTKLFSDLYLSSCTCYLTKLLYFSKTVLSM